MLTYGSQVNPALLRQDFSAIMQGAQARAQGIAQGAQIRGQAMANLGAQVGSTMSDLGKAYIKSREDNSILEAKNSAILSQNPELAKLPEVQEFNERKAKSGGLPLNDNIKLNALLTTSTEQARLAEEKKARDLTMEVNRFQLDKARADNQRAENDRRAYGNVFKRAGELGRMPTQDELFKLGLYEGMSPEAMASVTGMSQNSAEFGMKMNQFAEQIAKLRAENAQVAARNNRINGYLTSMPNGFRVVKDGQNDVFQSVNWETGEVTNKLLEKGSTPSAIQVLEKRQTETSKIFKAYTELLSRADRDGPENIKARNELVTQFNILNPKDDVQMNQTRENLDSMWGLQSPVDTTNPPPPGKDGASTPPPPSKSNIKGVSPAAPGTQPTPEPAAATQSSLNISGNQAAAFGTALMPNLNRAAPFASMGFNLIDDARRRFGGGQAAPAPAIDTSIGAPTPSAPPPVDLSAPASIGDAIPMGFAGMERGEGGEAVKLSKDERNVLQRAMSILDKTQPEGFDYKYAGRPAGGRPEPEGRLMALRAGFLPNINRAVPFASVAANAFEAMSPRSMGSSRAFSAPPAEQARAASAAPQFLDKDARATAAAMQAGMETPLPFERYKTPEQGPIPQIKLSPAAQKIAEEIGRSTRGGERGKAPEFFLESSTGDNGKRTRIKLSKQDLDMFLSRTPDTRGEVRMGAEFQPYSRSYGQQLRQFRAR